MRLGVTVVAVDLGITEVRLTGGDPDAGREEVSTEEIRDMVAAQQDITAEQRTIAPAPAGWRRMSSTNRSTASIPSLRPNGPQKITSEVRAWESSPVT